MVTIDTKPPNVKHKKRLLYHKNDAGASSYVCLAVTLNFGAFSQFYTLVG